MESVSRGEVELGYGSSPRPSIVDMVAAGFSFPSRVGCWVNLRVWEKLSIDLEVSFEHVNEFSTSLLTARPLPANASEGYRETTGEDKGRCPG